MTIYRFIALAANGAVAIASASAAIVPSPPTPPPVPETRMVIVPTPVTAPMSPNGRESVPIPKGYPGAWASTLDYPPLALVEEREGMTAFTLSIDAQGKVANCEVTASSGHADLDKVTCESVTRRATFYPAQDKKGKPTNGKYSNRVRWQIPSIATTASMPLDDVSYPKAPSMRNLSDLRVAKEDYPVAAIAALQEGYATFTLEIDANGTVQSCAISKTTNFPALDSQSCALAKKWQFDPARNLAGDPVAGRTSHYIRWRLPKGAVGDAPARARSRTNPFDKVGNLTMTLDFDKDGKLSDCAFEHQGEIGIFGAPPNLSDDLCKSGIGRRDVQPFVDATGKPQPRRVIVKISVDYIEIPVKPEAVAGN